MRLRVSLSPRRRDGLLLVLGLALVTAPFWVGLVPLAEPVHTYDRAEVSTVDDEIRYVDADDRSAVSGPLSEDVRSCLPQGEWSMGEHRFCVFEGSVATGEANVTVGHVDDPGGHAVSTYERLGGGSDPYVSVRGGTYEQTVSVDRSPDPDSDADEDRYAVSLDLESVDPDEALRDVALDASDDDVPGVVAEAATSGATQTRSEASVPQHPIEVDGGEHYRIYLAETEDPNPVEELLSLLLRYVAPLVGLWLLYVASGRFHVTHVGTGSEYQ